MNKHKDWIEKIDGTGLEIKDCSTIVISSHNKMYTLIAYKPESNTMSCGYVCDSWAADFNIHSYIEHKDLINLCANYASRRREDGENAYKLTINTVYDDQLFTCMDLMDDTLQDDRIGALYDEVLIRIHEIEEHRKECIRRDNEIKIAMEKLAEEKKKEDKLKRDLKDLERLKAIYEK